MATGPKNGLKEPSRIAIPSRKQTNPKYIGWRVKANGPPVIKAEGLPFGLAVVWLRLKRLSAQRFIPKPKKINKIPKRLSGGLISLLKGNKKLRTTIIVK